MASLILKKTTQNDKRDKILEEIRLVKIQLQNVSVRFELESDSDLVEATIYEMESLKAKYRYLMKLAKEYDMS